MASTVALQHDLPDGSAHVDWMLARDDRERAPLITFRLDRAPSACAPGTDLDAERLPDHRPLYLDYQGAISGNRGTVRRLARGTIEVLDGDCDAAEWTVTVRWHEGPIQVIRCRVGADGRWRISLR